MSRLCSTPAAGCRFRKSDSKATLEDWRRSLLFDFGGCRPQLDSCLPSTRYFRWVSLPFSIATSPTPTTTKIKTTTVTLRTMLRGKEGKRTERGTTGGGVARLGLMVGTGVGLTKSPTGGKKIGSDSANEVSL